MERRIKTTREAKKVLRDLAKGNDWATKLVEKHIKEMEEKEKK